MNPTKALKKWMKRCRLFHEQDGKCHWCKCEMELTLRPKRGQVCQPNLATFEHLDDRLSPERGKHPGERRVVLACWECNNQRAYVTQRMTPIEEIRRRCSRPARQLSA